MKSQTDEILAYLKSGKSITGLSAYQRFRCMRLAARIMDIRERGFMVLTTMKKRRNKHTGRNTRYAEYTLERKA
jgi:hypothetical protein